VLFLPLRQTTVTLQCSTPVKQDWGLTRYLLGAVPVRVVMAVVVIVLLLIVCIVLAFDSEYD